MSPNKIVDLSVTSSLRSLSVQYHDDVVTRLQTLVMDWRLPETLLVLHLRYLSVP